MSQVEDLLRRRSIDYLLDASHAAVVTDEDGARVLDERLGRIVLGRLNEVLKIALDTADITTFTKVEEDWQEIPEEELTWEDGQDAAGARLADYRRTLGFGLAMWALHLLRAPSEPSSAPEDARRQALSVLASRFTGVEEVLKVYEQAAEGEESDRLPWSDWFLGELPTGKVHVIPTSHELLFTALLLATAFTDPAEDVERAPREWLTWREEEIEQDLDSLAREADRWAPLFLAPSQGEEILASGSPQADWSQRVEQLRSQLAAARASARKDQKRGVRSAPIDPNRREEFERTLLAAVRERRVIRHIFAQQGALREAEGRQGDQPDLAFRQWLPKDLFIADSNVLGGDWVARQLATGPTGAEVGQLIEALPQAEPRRCESEEELSAALAEETARMRDEAHTPTLILAPVTWRLRQALGLSPVGHGLPSGGHDLVPTAVAGSIGGIVEDVPLLDSPMVPPRSLWLLSLPGAVRMVEWPSQADSGVKVSFEIFPGEEARELLERQPGIAGEQSLAEAVERIQEQVLLIQTLCWAFEKIDPAASRQIEIPKELAFEP